MNLKQTLLLGFSAFALNSCINDSDVKPEPDKSPKGRDEVVQMTSMHFGENGVTMEMHSGADSSATGLDTDMRMFLEPERKSLYNDAAVIFENYKRIPGDSAEANGWVVSMADKEALFTTDTGVREPASARSRPIPVGGIQFNGKFPVYGNTTAVQESGIWNKNYSKDQFRDFNSSKNDISDKNCHIILGNVNGLMVTRKSERQDGKKKAEFVL